MCITLNPNQKYLHYQITFLIFDLTNLDNVIIPILFVLLALLFIVNLHLFLINPLIFIFQSQNTFYI